MTSPNSSSPVVLLSAAGHPKHTGIGEQYLNSLSGGHSNSRYLRHALTYAKLNQSDGESCEADLLLESIPHSNFWFLSDRALSQFRQSILPAHLERFTAFAEPADVIWWVLNSPEQITLAAAVSDQLDKPSVVMVWDEPDYLLRNRRLRSSTRVRLLKEFEQVLQSSQAIVSISPGMSEKFRSLYGVESQPLAFCPNESSWLSPQDKQGRNSIEIVFAGSLYAWREWQAMLDAVEQYNANLTSNEGGLPVNVTCIGRQSRWSKKRAWVKYVGHLPGDEAAKLVNQGDIGYLPYWFSPKHSSTVQTAFPSKLPFYVASGIPVLYHGPQQSSPTSFLQKYRVGIGCHTNRADDIIASINYLTRDPKFQNGFLDQREIAKKEAIGPSVASEVFAQTVHAVNAKR